jgi:glycosyltransferase involved in cell wall biosynthesis
MISLIICTHNPSEKIFPKVLEALKNQILDKAFWELLVVDNRSSIAVAECFDLSWHPNHRILVEQKPGLLAARLAAINEASGDILVFVDDDNLLDTGYLEEVLRIAETFPMLGIWGGSSLGVYETSPPEWIRRREHHLSVRLITENVLSNGKKLIPPWIIGAGMVVRREVAEEYASRMRTDARRASLGRNVSRLIGGEDLDMSMTACDMGLYRGVFSSLSLSHLIPKTRTEPQRFLLLVEGNSFSTTYLEIIRNGLPEEERLSVIKKIRRALSDLLLPPEESRYRKAVERGRRAAITLALRESSGEVARSRDQEGSRQQ